MKSLQGRPWRLFAIGALVVGMAAIAVACGRQPAPAPAPPVAAAPPAAPQPPEPGPVGASFRHVNLHVDDGIVLEISRLDGALIGAKPGVIPIFDDPHSFTMRIDSGEVAMSPESLSSLLNQHVFAYEGAPLTHLTLSFEEAHLKLKGTVHKGVGVPFSVESEVSLTADGRIRLHPLHVKVLGIPSIGLMKLFGIELDNVIKLKETSGLEIDGDDFLLASDRVLSSPKISGRLTAVRVQGNRLVEVFGAEKAGAALGPPAKVANYLYFRGGTLRFGRLTMTDADVDIVDDSPHPVFEFSLPHYRDQLVAGYSKTTPSGGLVVHMKDYQPAVTPAARK